MPMTSPIACPSFLEKSRAAPGPRDAPNRPLDTRCLMGRVRGRTTGIGDCRSRNRIRGSREIEARQCHGSGEAECSNDCDGDGHEQGRRVCVTATFGTPIAPGFDGAPISARAFTAVLVTPCLSRVFQSKRHRHPPDKSPDASRIAASVQLLRTIQTLRSRQGKFPLSSTRFSRCGKLNGGRELASFSPCISHSLTCQETVLRSHPLR